jgi:hypothetical protein
MDDTVPLLISVACCAGFTVGLYCGYQLRKYDESDERNERARAMSYSGYVHLEECKILRTREKAIQILYQGERHWIPRSQMADDDQYEEGQDGVTVSISEWIASEKGIEVDE